MSDPLEMDVIEFNKKIEKLDAQLKKAIELNVTTHDKYDSLDDFPDEVLISYVHNLELMCHLYGKKGGLIRPNVEAVYGETNDPDSMTEHIMSQVDDSLDTREHGAYVVSIIKERKIPVKVEDLVGWWLFDNALISDPASESYNIIDRENYS